MDYTNIGLNSGYNKENISYEVERLKWIDLNPGMSLPFAQGEGIKNIIKSFKLPHISKIAIHGGIKCVRGSETFTAGLYGLLAHYKNGVRELYFADEGSEIIALGSKLK